MGMIFGTVDATGNKVRGSNNWTVRRSAVGLYIIDTDKLAIIPVVVATGFRQSGDGGVAINNAFTIMDPTTDAFVVQSRDLSGAGNQDAPFSVIAMFP